MSEFENLVALCECAMELVAVFEILEEAENTSRRSRRYAVRPINRNRDKHGYFNVSFTPMKNIDSEQFFIYTRMSAEVYNVLLRLFTPLAKKHSRREPIQPECRLALLLIYLTQGSTVQQIAWQFKMGKETVRSIILESAEVLWKHLGTIYVSTPNVIDYEEIENDFWHMWNMPNCIGAVDGKHIAIKCPPNSGSQFYNYKKFFSIVLMATCDAKYRFTNIDLGAYGSQSDGGIFQLSTFGKKVITGDLPFPVAKVLPNTSKIIPYYFVGDAAFPLSKHLMRPYPGRHLPQDKEYFNRRLSRARRTIENAFGILVARWRILTQTIHMSPENAEKIVLVCVLLHNYVMLNNDARSTYCPDNYYDGETADGQITEGLWRSEVSALPSIAPSSTQHNYGGVTSRAIRDELRAFVNANPIF